MQPAGWNQPESSGASAPAWPPPAAAGGTPPTGWNSPPPPGWGDPAPGAGSPTATWGSPSGQPAWGSPPAESRSVVGTVVAHLVLWIGLVVVGVTSPYLVELAYRTALVPYELFQGLLAVYNVLPVALALVIAGRSGTLRLAGLIGAVVLVGGEVLLNVVRFDGPVYLLVDAMAVAGLGTWITVRRHALWGYATLVPAAAFAYVWYQTDLLASVRGFPIEQGFPRPVIYLWFDLPILALAVLGLVSSLLRPRPAAEHDSRGVVVVAGLAGLVVLAALVVGVL